MTNRLIRIDVNRRLATSNQETWPFALASVGDGWRVNNIKTDLRDGGIYVFDKHWRFQHRVPLPKGPDRIDLLRHQDRVLVSDYSRNRVYQIGLDGVSLDEFTSPEVRQLLSANEKKGRRVEHVSGHGR